MATAAAAIIGKARRDVISYFLQRNAVSANAAVTWVPERNVQRRMLARFLRNGVVIEEAPDTYFVDVAAYDRWRRGMRRRAAAMAIGVGVVGAILAALA
jgi:hypothetical protein